MITTILKAAATTAGCDQVFYESKELAGIITDQAQQGKVFCLIIQPDTCTLNIAGNGIREHFATHYVEVMQQVKLEDTAENNEVVYANLLEICKKLIYALIVTGSFQKIASITATKIPENKYDFNPIGWSIPLDLQLIENKANC
jgi:hypothetical protein